MLMINVNSNLKKSWRPLVHKPRQFRQKDELVIKHSKYNVARLIWLLIMSSFGPYPTINTLITWPNLVNSNLKKSGGPLIHKPREFGQKDELVQVGILNLVARSRCCAGARVGEEDVAVVGDDAPNEGE